MSDLDARRKLFLGPQIRKLRRNMKLTQAQMADGLDISASYLTLIERNQRPLTAQLILRLADVYDVDVRALAPHTDASMRISLREVSGDPVLSNLDLPLGELEEMADLFPRAAEALVRLHERYRQAREDANALADTDGPRTALGNSAVEEAREALQANDNYYAALEDAAADIVTRGALRTDLPQSLTANLVTHLKERHNVDVVIMPYDVMKGLLRRFDRHRRRLLLSELLAPSGRTFQVASVVGQLEAGELVRALAQHPALSSDSSRGMYRLTLGNYLAGAIMLPYDRFLEAAERLRYDVDVLASRFGASFEQAAHRLTTLRRPGARGVPFFMIRVDRAGNISKRFGGDVFPFARSGGTCPRWRLYEAFRVPGRVVVDIAALPEGQTFLTIARTVDRPGQGANMPGQELVVGLGAETTYADRLVYAEGFDRKHATTPIGVNCRVCPREDCTWRAVPPLTGTLAIDPNRRSLTPYHVVS